MQSSPDASSPHSSNATTNPSTIEKKLCGGSHDLHPASPLCSGISWTICECQTLIRCVWQGMQCQNDFCSLRASGVDEITPMRKQELCDDGGYDVHPCFPSPSDGNLWICCRCKTMNRDRTECRYCYHDVCERCVDCQ